MTTGILTIAFIGTKLWIGSHDVPHAFLVSYVNNIILGISGSYFILFAGFRLSRYHFLVTVGLWEGCFGIYLVHQFVLKYLYYHTSFPRLISGPGAPFIALAAALIISYLVTWLLLRNRHTRKLV